MQNKKLQRLLLTKYSFFTESEYTLEDVSEIKYGMSIEASKLTSNYSYPVYGGNGIIGTLNTYMFDEHKIIISCRGAASGTVSLTKQYSNVSSNSLYLNLKNPNFLVPLYSYLLTRDLSIFTTGSAQPQITIDNIRKLKVPNISSLNDNSYLFVIEKIEQSNRKINNLNLTKKILLDKYF